MIKSSLAVARDAVQINAHPALLPHSQDDDIRVACCDSGAGLHSMCKCHVRLLSLKVVPLGGNLDAGGGKLVTLVLQGKRGLNDGVWRRSPPRVRCFQLRLPRWGGALFRLQESEHH